MINDREHFIRAHNEYLTPPEEKHPTTRIVECEHCGTEYEVDIDDDSFPKLCEDCE
jgi:hypothetical protein